MATTSRLGLDKTDVRRARTLARQVGRPIVKLAQQHTTVSVERATLRLAGLGGADPDGTPWVNRLADVVRADVGLEHGVSLPVWDALLRGDGDDLLTLAQKAAAGSVTFRVPEGKDGEPYYFPDDMAEKAIDWLHRVRAEKPAAPWFMYYSTGCSHAPHHVPREWSDKYAGKFDEGWDALRERTLARQKELGVVPANALAVVLPWVELLTGVLLIAGL